MIQGPDNDSPAIDHEARLTLIEHAYMTDGTISAESVQYLLWLGRLSEQMDKASEEMKDAFLAYEAVLLNAIQSLTSENLALKEQLDNKS